MAAETALVANRLSDTKESGTLNLSGCKLLKIPASIYIFLKDATVTSCDLSNNGLSSIPVKLFRECPTVKEMNLSKNKLQNLPDDLILLKTLHKLDLSSNGITDLPPCVYQLQGLKELSLQDNSIEYMNMDLLQEMASLETLHLEENPLTDEAIEKLNDLGGVVVTM